MKKTIDINKFFTKLNNNLNSESYEPIGNIYFLLIYLINYKLGVIK